jgi:hypothetical protein
MAIASKWSTGMVLRNFPWLGTVSKNLERWWMCAKLCGISDISHLGCHHPTHPLISLVGWRKLRLETSIELFGMSTHLTVRSLHAQSRLHIASHGLKSFPVELFPHIPCTTYIYSSWHWYNRSHLFHNHHHHRRRWNWRKRRHPIRV